MHSRSWLGVIVVTMVAAGCTRPAVVSTSIARATVKPGISVLLDDSLGLIRNKRIGLLTNQTGIDEYGISDIERLRDASARAAGVTLVRLFSPEHGIRGTEDRQHIASGIDERSGLTVVSLYTETTVAPPDSTLADLDALVIDLQDVGTRTWTYVGAVDYAMRAGARRHLPIIVLDRPNPLSGLHVDGPMLDTALSNPEENTKQRPGKAYALYPFPLRHGMTMGELALFYNSVLGINAPLHVVPMQGWRRAMWFDQTGLPWVKPSPNLPTLQSALLYPSLVAFEGSNVSVGRGTDIAFQRFGAPWMDASRVAQLLNGRHLPGVEFVVDSFTPQNPGDGKYRGRHIPGVRIAVSDRNAIQSGHVAAAVLWALERANHDSLKLRPVTFDERFGNTSVRQAIVSGADPTQAMNAQRGPVAKFLDNARRFFLYQ